MRSIIRPLTPTDSLDALTALLHTAYASLAAQGWNFTAATQSVHTTRERLRDGQAFVVEQVGELLGTVCVHGPKRAGEAHGADPPPLLYTQAGNAILSQLAVHPRVRSQGLAERLMDRAEAWARAQGHARVVLDTAEPAEALRRRYARRGYVEVGAVQWAGKTYRSVLMSKSLET